jgi:hypothetical protein
VRRATRKLEPGSHGSRDRVFTIKEAELLLPIFSLIFFPAALIVAYLVSDRTVTV